MANLLKKTGSVKNVIVAYDMLIRFTMHVFRNVYQFVCVLLSDNCGMWDLIVLVPGLCLSFYVIKDQNLRCFK